MNILNLMFIIVVAICLFSVLTEIDIAKRYFPPLKSAGIFVNLVRIIHTVLTWYEVWRLLVAIIIATLLISIIIPLLNSELIVGVDTNQVEQKLCPETNQCIICNARKSNNSRRYEYQQKLKLHNELTVFETLLTEICSVFNPIGLFFVGFIIVICNYGTIKMLDKIDPFMYPLFPLCYMAAVVVVCVVLPSMCCVNEVSIKFIRQLRSQAKSKFEFKTAQAIRPNRRNIGHLFYFNRGTKIKYLDVLSSHTVNVLLMPL